MGCQTKPISKGLLINYLVKKVNFNHLRLSNASNIVSAIFPTLLAFQMLWTTTPISLPHWQKNVRNYGTCSK